jgi:hypothetical protein
MRRRTFTLAVLAILAGAGLGGCDMGTHGSDNSAKSTPTGPATIIKFPYGFRNVAYKCDGTTMVYSLSAGVDDTSPGGIAVVANDPRCK